MDFFPIENWEDSSPLKQFLRKLTIDWTSEFEQYIPSVFAWLIVINIIPILTSGLEIFYRIHKPTIFPVKYSLNKLIKFLVKTNCYT